MGGSRESFDVSVGCGAADCALPPDKIPMCAITERDFWSRFCKDSASVHTIQKPVARGTQSDIAEWIHNVLACVSRGRQETHLRAHSLCAVCVSFSQTSICRSFSIGCEHVLGRVIRELTRVLFNHWFAPREQNVLYQDMFTTSLPTHA